MELSECIAAMAIRFSSIFTVLGVGADAGDLFFLAVAMYFHCEATANHCQLARCTLGNFQSLSIATT